MQKKKTATTKHVRKRQEIVCGNNREVHAIERKGIVEEKKTTQKVYK